MVTAVHKDAEPREINECFPRPDWIMHLVDLDEETGSFTAVMDAPGPAAAGS
jgi:hypothetical protein